MVRVGGGYEKNVVERGGMRCVKVEVMGNCKNIEMVTLSLNDQSKGIENFLDIWTYGEVNIHCQDLFSQVLSTPLPHLSRRGRDQVSIKERSKVEKKAMKENRPLPEGILFDGRSYVDFTGKRFEKRPDIEELVDEYLEKENLSIDEYNNRLDRFNLGRK